MATLLVRRPDGTQVATVVKSGKTSYAIDTVDEDVRRLIQGVLDRAEEDGIAFHTYRRLKTDEGMRYQRLGRWLQPGAGDFLQAVGDYLTNYDLFAYPVETSDR